MTRAFRGSAMNAWTCAAVIGPMSGTSSISAVVAARKALQGPEMPRERFCRRLADVANAECEQEPRKRRGLAALERLDQLGGRFLAHAVELGELRNAEPVQVRGILHEPEVHELVDQLAAEAFDVHRPPGRKMAERLLQLGRTHECARAAGDRLALLALHVGSADRALLRQLVRQPPWAAASRR